ncbi:hypothetical protein BGZ70_000493 [Mortierella alpina]|uniref:Uncharacterized protein n=1 Tax=Mortierella alpina TaxID=64518 RepID=A0A9P6IY70_MORAP|nr:hypothetical protein BGZ70_000493 [Mortierella alpina]
MLSGSHSKPSSSSTARHPHLNSDGYAARPSSFASSYRTQLSRKSSFSSCGSRHRRRSQCLSGQEKHHGGKPKTFRKDYEKESNAAFDRICLMLTDLITDASTAAGIEPSLSGDEDMSRTVDWARVESDLTDSDESTGEQHEETEDLAPEDGVLEEDPELTIAPQSEEGEEQWHWRRRLRTQMEKPSKRTSLFLELQNLHIEQDMDHTTAAEDFAEQDAGCSADDESAQGDENEAEPVFNATALSPSWDAQEHHSDGIACSEDMTSDSDSDGDTTFHSGVFSSGPRRCSSFPSRPVDLQQLQQGEELHQAIQQVDSELDRAAQTIDGLTRDLMMVVASQQSWLQMKLEREIQSQHSMQSGAVDDDLLATLDRYYDDRRADSAAQLNLESNEVQDANIFSSSAKDLYIPSRSLLSSEDLSKYLQALKTIMDLKQELGFGILDDEHSQEYSDDGMMTQMGGYTGGDEPIHSDLDGSDRRFSGSSYTLTNGSFRHSAASTFSLATRFDPFSTTPQSEDLDPLAKMGLSLKPGHISSRSVFKYLQRQDVLSSIDVQLEEQDTLASDLEANHKAMQPQPWPVVQHLQQQQLAAAQEQDMDLILRLHRDLLLKMAGLGTKWMTINVHLPLFIFWSFIFGIGTIFMQTSVAKHAGKRLVRPLESMGRLLEVEDRDTLAEPLLNDTPTT